MKKVLIMLAEGFEVLEALSVKDVCTRAGVICDLCGVNSKKIKSSHNIVVETDLSLDDEGLSNYDAIVIPGGMPGALNLKESIRVVELVKDYYATGKIVASICAGPIVLAKAGILNGRKVTSYPGYEEELGNVIYKEDIVVIDENIITSRGSATAIEFSLAIIKELGYVEKANEIRAGMLVNFYLGNK